MNPAGVVPERTGDPAEARTLLDMDGVAILETGSTGPDGSEAGARAVLGDRLRAYRRPVFIGTNPDPTPAVPFFFDRATRTVNADGTRRGPLHVDGYLSYGVAYPDVVFLLCARQADSGGESVVIDGHRLLAGLAADRAQRDLLRFLWTRPIEQSTHDGVRVTCPTARRTPGGRVSVLCHDDQRPVDDAAPDEDVETMLARWRAVTEAAVDAAPRFLLRPGDLLCLDNYRVFHCREAYAGRDRLLHRIWSWTDAAFAVPDPTPHNDLVVTS